MTMDEEEKKEAMTATETTSTEQQEMTPPASSASQPSDEEESTRTTPPSDPSPPSDDKDDVIPIVEEQRTFGAAASSLLGGTSSSSSSAFKQGPLMAKLSSWGKQANYNAKDFLSRQRTQWKAPNVVPVGGILGSAISQPIESAQLEKPSPTKTQPNEEDGDNDETNANIVQTEANNGNIDSTAALNEEEMLVDGEPNIRSLSSTQSPPTDVTRRRVQSSDSSQFEEDGSEVSSYYSSTYTESQEGGSFKGTFRWAAASVVDSVQTYRGRYNSANSNNLATPVPFVKTLSAASSASQTHRILQSRAKDHLAHLMEGLEHHEYIMLLGHGLLGVNLKATFLQNRGVYVDYLVPNGAAESSQVIKPGDALLRIGDADVQRSNIYKVPGQIAAAARPVHLVLATGLPPKHLYEIGHLDVAVALLHQWQEEQQQKEESTPGRSNLSRKQLASAGSQSDDDDVGNDDDSSREAVANLGTASSEAPTDEGDEKGVSLVHPTSFDSCDTAPRQKIDDLPSMSDVLDQNQGKSWFWLPPPENALRETCREDCARRCSDLRATTAGVRAEATTLERALQFALLEVVEDYRKRSFWERHIKTLATDKPDQSPPGALLVLFLELLDFMQYYDLMDENQRSATVHRIAHTYFVPTTDTHIGMVPPLLDFHHLVGDTSLREIEAVLKHQKPLTRNVWADCFEAAVGELARDSFLQFVQSDECARMRGHLRHTAPFWNVPIPTIVERLCAARDDTSAHAQNYAIFLLTYLLCQTDNEGIGELLDLDSAKGPRTRIEGAASGFCAALFIKGAWLRAVRSGKTETILARYQQLWDTYLSPSVGSLAMTSLSPKASSTLDAVLEALEGVRSHPDADLNLVLPLLVDDVLVNRIHKLANDLLYDYARRAHPKFTVHKFHEWMSQEAVKLLSDDQPLTRNIPHLPPGSIKRFLRKVEFPSGVSAHKPTRSGSEKGSKPSLTAECVVVFGNSIGLDIMGAMDNEDDARRYACESIVVAGSDQSEQLQPELIPPTLEAYASVPMSKKQPMSSYVNQHWISSDGWEVALVNFTLPRTDTGGDEAGDGSLYGVSLVFQRLLSSMVDTEQKDVPTQLVAGSCDDDASPVSFDLVGGSTTRQITVSGCAVTNFNANLKERNWRERITREVRPGRTVAKIGIALVSQSNAIISMREALTKFLNDFSRTPDDDDKPSLICGPLVDVLGNFAHHDVESSLVTALLRPYIARSVEKWIDRPLSAQQDEFEKDAGEQIVNSLPPIALALMFVTALLEQKMVITSKRRGLLLSSTVALKQMLQPLTWCHLIVPRVPTNLAADLLQYPAPFILGLPSDEPGVMELVRNLPEDVTLVDLDVGRVILAPSFAHNSELGRGSSTDSDTPAALRTQVLYLAQSLGTIFGASTDGPLWACDRPHISECGAEDSVETSRFSRLKRACQDFVEELLAGTTSCCYWIEESSGDTSANRARPDPTVFFDEDHFFHLKNKRSEDLYKPLIGSNSASGHLSLALEDFDLIFELFLRCQSMSMYIGNLDRSSMVYAG